MSLSGLEKPDSAMCHTRKPLPYKPKQSHGTLPIKPELKSLSPKHGDCQQPSASILFCTTTGGSAGRKGFPVYSPTTLLLGKGGGSDALGVTHAAGKGCGLIFHILLLQRAPLAFPSHFQKKEALFGLNSETATVHEISFSSQHFHKYKEWKEKNSRNLFICFLSFVSGTEC